jgi:hypothetical protein
LGAFVALVLVAGVATGCLTAEVDVEIDDDRSGKVVLEVFPSDEFRDQLRSVDLEAVEELSSTDAASVEISEIGTVGRRGYRLEVEFDDYEVLGRAGVDGVRLGGQDLSVFTSFDLVEDEGAWILAAQLRPLQEISDALRGLLGVGTVDRRPEVAISVKLPGRVVRSNATTQEGGTARWELSFEGPINAANAPTDLRMQTEPVPLLTPAQWVIAGAIGVIALGMVLWVYSISRVPSGTSGRRRRRRRRGGGDPSGWDREPVDAPREDQPVVAPPLPWQTYQPGDAPTPDVPAAPIAVAAAPVVQPEPESEPKPETEPEPAAPAAGWYPDPADPTRHRWWDGTAWTDHTS